MERTKEQGITLIALVITIIVLLILAGVALATLTGNSSIIDNANYAVAEYNKSANSDQNVLNQVENLFAKYMGETNVTGDDDDNDDNVIGNLASTVHVGDYITYNPTLGVTNSALLSYTSQAGELKVKNSSNEYVINENGTDTYNYNGAYKLFDENGVYTVPNGYTEETDEVGNGYGQQSFTATANNNLWRVLEVNTTTGVVKIIPQTPIKTTTNNNFYLLALRGYKNAITELNKISGLFGHGQGADKAESIKVEKINELMGRQTYRSETPNNVEGLEGSWYDTYDYCGKQFITLDSAIEDILFKDSYWLASPCLYSSSRVGLMLFIVDSWGLHVDELYAAHSYDYEDLRR